MNTKILVFSTLISSVLYLGPVQAHNPGYGGGYDRDISGSVSIWSGAPYGPGYSGTINYGRGYAPAPPYAGAHYFPTCDHWHPKAYRAPRNHAYGNGYAHGYSDGHSGGHKGHKKSKHKRGHGYDRDRHH